MINIYVFIAYCYFFIRIINLIIYFIENCFNNLNFFDINLEKL